MRVGIPKEIKLKENRVGITPAGVKSLKDAGHDVLVEAGAGAGSMITDAEFKAAGASMVSVDEVWKADMVMKVKEPLTEEFKYFREGLILYTYLHLAAEKALTDALLAKKVIGIAYETVQLPDNSLPLLAPMSEVAGRMATQVGAQILTKHEGGAGLLLGGVPGVHGGHCVIVGGGVVGLNSAKMAVGLGARVTILDNSINRLRYLDDIFGSRIQTLFSNSLNIASSVKDADLLVGSVLIPGAKAPKLVSTEMVKTMRPGSVIVDVAIDQGGSIETIDRVTYHDNPTYEAHGVVHYAVGNMPGAVPRTSTFALTNATAYYAVQLANKGWKKACQDDRALALGINTANGKCVYKGVADAFGLECVTLESVLA